MQEQQETARLLAGTPTGTIGPIKPNSSTGDIFLDRQVPSMQIGMVMMPLVVASPYTAVAADALVPYVGGKTVAGGLIGGGTDFVGQLSQKDWKFEEVRPEQVFVATLTAAAAVPLRNGNAWIDMGIGAANGAVNAGFQNMWYGDKNSIELTALIGGGVSAGGNVAATYVRRSNRAINLEFNGATPFSVSPVVVPNNWREPAARTINVMISGIPAFFPMPQDNSSK